MHVSGFLHVVFPNYVLFNDLVIVIQLAPIQTEFSRFTNVSINNFSSVSETYNLSVLSAMINFLIVTPGKSRRQERSSGLVYEN